MTLSHTRLLEILTTERNKAAQKIEILHQKLAAFDFVLDNFYALNSDKNLQHRDIHLNPLKASRIPLTRIVVNILEKHPAGLTLDEIVKAAHASGISIKTSSTSTMLNRLKMRDVVDHYGRVYRLKRTA